jgi:ABC-type branched-subunit amino acid transport system ATPase component
MTLGLDPPSPTQAIVLERPAVEGRNLYKSFGGVKALENVSLRVLDREIFGLIGPNGSGKTTLLNLLAGFYRPDAGQVLLRGKSITGSSANQIARHGMLRCWQDPRVVPAMTIRDNVELGWIASGRFKGAPHDVVAGLLQKFGFVDVADEPAGMLSYGKQKIIALARSLAAQPRVLLLDEPLAGLSLPEQQEMIGYIRDFRSNGTVVIVDHAFGVIMKLCDRVMVLNAGRKLAEGTPTEIAANKAVAEVYLG